MEIGDYARTDKGKIGKIVHFEPRDKYPYSYNRVILDTEGHKRTTRNIIKCSESIIDLIEVGDYVNGNKIVHIQEEEFPDYPKRLLFAGVDENNIDDVWEVYNNEDIKSIVTHEQFESMEYKVGE